MTILEYGPDNGTKDKIIGIEDSYEYYNYLKRNGTKIKDFIPKLRENNITHLYLYLIYVNESFRGLLREKILIE